jgi:beta-glucosidase
MNRNAMNHEQIRSFVSEVLSSLTLDEKIYQMHGRTSLFDILVHRFILFHYNYRPYWAAGVKRYGIPSMGFSDGPRGVVVGHSTCFPVAMARAATWDVELQQRVGDAIGRECRAQGANYFGGGCVNLLHHPAGGRAQESYGEDPYLVGEMGAALVSGVSHHNVITCVKHYALNNIEDTRLKGVNIEIDERALREVYLPHFKRTIQAGAASVMGAYNKVRGEYCCENKYLLKDILKGEWNFTGFTISDFLFGIHDVAKAANAGLDMEMCGDAHYRKLKEEILAGNVSEETIDEAVRRILTTIVDYETRPDTEEYSKDKIASELHRNLAREVAEESIVLLKNAGPLLPIDEKKVKSLCVIGKLAREKNIGDHGSSEVKPSYVVTPYEGILAAAGKRGIDVCYTSGENMSSTAELAKKADLVVVFAGMSHKDEGEGGVDVLNIGGDRDNLSLHESDIALIKNVAKINPNIVVVLIAGSTLTVEEWKDDVPSILMAWYGGMEGGNALARVLFGETNPCGHLPFVVPKNESQLPPFDHKSLNVHYDYFHGYTYMDKYGRIPEYPFGFGLSYTNFELKDISAKRETDKIRVMVTASNTGERAGKVVIQVYIGWVASAVERPKRVLKAFTKVHLEVGESKQVELAIPVDSLAYFDEKNRKWVIEDNQYDVFIGQCNSDEELLSTRV